MFHIGHLNIIQRSKEMCDFLIVGVKSDDLVKHKNKSAIIQENERLAIVESIRYIAKTVFQTNMNKM